MRFRAVESEVVHKNRRRREQVLELQRQVSVFFQAVNRRKLQRNRKEWGSKEANKFFKEDNRRGPAKSWPRTSAGGAVGRRVHLLLWVEASPNPDGRVSRAFNDRPEGRNPKGVHPQTNPAQSQRDLGHETRARKSSVKGALARKKSA